VSAEEPGTEVGGWTRGRIVGVTVGAALAAGLVLLLVLGLARGSDGADLFERDIAAGDPPAAPQVALPVLFAGGPVGPEGATYDLASLRGKSVVLNLWASWCPPCREEAPILQRLWERYRDKDVVVLGIDTQDGSAEARAFIREFGLTFPSLRDGTDTTQGRFQTSQLPETFVIDPEGKIRLVYRGGLTTAQEAEIAAGLDRLAAE
jgi:cytochrome c biogenesis protein CcmG/thiol:disulfide interchange protein DsbE